MPSTRLVPVGGIRHTLAEPGETQVAVRYEVDAASGRVHLTARYAGATDAPTLPAFGLEWTLPKQYENLRFYGLGPEETYHDRLHGGKLGIFERTAAEVVPGFLRTLVFARLCDDDQFAACTVSPSRDMSR